MNVDFRLINPPVTITGEWDVTKTNLTRPVIISGEVVLNGKTDCYSLTFASGGHLTINAGARLRVWEGGITNDDCETVNYLTIYEDAVNDSYGEFLLHPDVTVNNHPLASVEWMSTSWRESSSNLCWAFLGTPVYSNARSITSTVSQGNKYQAFISLRENDAWIDLGLIGGNNDNNPNVLSRINLPFNIYNILSNRTQTDVPQKITISGDLVCNIDGNLNCSLRYNAFANSYTSRIKSEYILDAIDKSANISKLQYPKQNTDGSVTWIDITRENIDEYPYLNPLAGFILNNNVSVEIFTLSYRDLVWNPSFEPEITPVAVRGTKGGAPKPIDGMPENPKAPDFPEDKPATK